MHAGSLAKINEKSKNKKRWEEMEMTKTKQNNRVLKLKSTK